MPTESLYPSIDVPNQDIFGFLFERKHGPFPGRPFPEDKGESGHQKHLDFYLVQYANSYQ